jgi:exopolyphosphatase / guanosine-5'-triphosphate,3'-diphosphate pyrophosphatase
VRVAVVDVGSSSVRLLVASVKRRGLRELDRDRVYLRLGDDAYRLGRIGARKLDELEYVAEHYAQRARLARVERLETIVTAPGRQSTNADELVEVLLDATRAPVTVLSAEEEARLAWEGAVAAMPDPPSSVSVVDLGGGSCEVAVGRTELGPTWVASRDAGALRVTSAFLRGERASASTLDWARTSVRELLDGLDAPRPDTALAIGGTARAVAKILGPRFGPKKLDTLADRLARIGAARVIGALDVTPQLPRPSWEGRSSSPRSRVDLTRSSRSEAAASARAPRSRSRVSNRLRPDDVGQTGWRWPARTSDGASR